MKTAKQLETIYVNRVFGPYKQVYEASNFNKFVKDKIYKGHTTADRLRMAFKLPATFDGYKEQLPKKFAHTWEELEQFVKNDSNAVTRRILSRFEWFRVHLNDLLDEEKD